MTNSAYLTYTKAAAQAMFKKNPNMYFYRHNEPGVVRHDEQNE